MKRSSYETITVRKIPTGNSTIEQVLFKSFATGINLLQYSYALLHIDVFNLIGSHFRKR